MLFGPTPRLLATCIKQDAPGEYPSHYYAAIFDRQDAILYVRPHFDNNSISSFTYAEKIIEIMMENDDSKLALISAWTAFSLHDDD